MFYHPPEEPTHRNIQRIPLTAPRSPGEVPYSPSASPPQYYTYPSTTTYAPGPLDLGIYVSGNPETTVQEHPRPVAGKEIQ